MNYLDRIKNKHIEDLKFLLQDSLNLPDINNQLVGAIKNELSLRGVAVEVQSTNNNEGYVVHLTEVGHS